MIKILKTVSQQHSFENVRIDQSRNACLFIVYIYQYELRFYAKNVDTEFYFLCSDITSLKEN